MLHPELTDIPVITKDRNRESSPHPVPQASTFDEHSPSVTFPGLDGLGALLKHDLELRDTHAGRTRERDVSRDMQAAGAVLRPRVGRGALIQALDVDLISSDVPRAGRASGWARGQRTFFERKGLACPGKVLCACGGGVSDIVFDNVRNRALSPRVGGSTEEEVLPRSNVSRGVYLHLGACGEGTGSRNCSQGAAFDGEAMRSAGSIENTKRREGAAVIDRGDAVGRQAIVLRIRGSIAKAHRLEVRGLRARADCTQQKEQQPEFSHCYGYSIATIVGISDVPFHT